MRSGGLERDVDFETSIISFLGVLCVCTSNVSCYHLSSVLFSVTSEILELPPSSLTHDVSRIVNRFYPPQPRQVSTIHLLQRCVENRVIRIRRCVREVLAILLCHRSEARRGLLDRIEHEDVGGFEGPCEVEVDRLECCGMLCYGML